ncbi:MAG: hypothetical protein ACK5GU_11635 [Chloroflexota bacterium]|jgi:hypothetical protein
MKSFQRYLDVVVAILSFGLLISLWPYRDAVVRDAYAATTTDIGQIAQINIIGFHNIETNEQGVDFRWGRQYVTLPIALPTMKNNAAVVSFYGTTLTTQPVTLTIDTDTHTTFTVQGSTFRSYHLLVNHTGIHQEQTSVTVTTTDAQTIKGQELGIALGQVSFTPLKTAFVKHATQHIQYVGDQFAMLLVVAFAYILITRNITLNDTMQLLIRVISIVSMMSSMYISADLPLSAFLGGMIISVPLVIYPQRITLSPWLRSLVTRYPHHVVYVLFATVAIIHLLVDTKATLCTLNSYIPCVNHTWNFATGDEPSYIRVAKNIKYVGTSMVDFDPDATKKYYVHSIGVSLLIVPTIVDIDILWTRISFILINGIVALLLYQLTGGIKLSNHAPLTIVQRVAITTVLVLAMPFIPGANQLYPDLIAGVCLLGVWYWVTNLTRTSPWFHLPFMVMMVALPWLHTKYFYISLGIAPVIGYALWRQQSTRLAGAFAGSYLASVALVMWYGQTAWGNPFGPVTSGSAPFTLVGISRLFGLVFDQNQGILWQNPLHVLGLCGLGLFYRRHRNLFWAWGWLFGVPLVLNALHVNPYGGISYSGRFHWSSAVMLYAVTVTMIVWLMMRMPTLTTRILVASLMVQSYFWYMYSTQTVLYPRAVSEALLLDHYTIMFGPLEPYLPQFYSLAVSLATPANYVWVGLIISAMGIVNYRMRHERFITAA